MGLGPTRVRLMPTQALVGMSESRLVTCALLRADEHPFSCVVLVFFFSTGDGDRCRKEVSAKWALHADALIAEFNWLGSDAGLSADSIRSALSLMSWSFLV